PVLDPADVLLSSRVRQLEDELALTVRAHGPDLPADGGPERDAVVAVDGGVVRQDAALDLHRHVRGDDGADPAARESLLEVDARRRPRAVVVVDAAGDARAEQAVLDRQVAHHQWLEDGVRRHPRSVEWLIRATRSMCWLSSSTSGASDPSMAAARCRLSSRTTSSG